MPQPVGYWNVIDILDFEPYVAGAYPYLIRAVYWASEFGLQATIDLHGVPGSQNGQDNSGLSNIVSFQANRTNFDRTLDAIRNLTEEFSRDIYNGTVTSKLIPWIPFSPHLSLFDTFSHRVNERAANQRCKLYDV